ncbi:Pancreatic progenitor cell differentiation and proliferation factor-like, partial [Phoenicopterus ruber ruber]
MASVPSAGCLLAKNQYYRSKCSGGRELPRAPPPPAGGLLWGREAEPPLPQPMSGQCLMVWALSPFAGLPEIIDKCWWIKSFFHCEPSPPTVGRKTLSAS